MKKILAATVTAAVMFLGAGDALAGTARYVTGNSLKNVFPEVTFTIASLTSSTLDTTIINVAGLTKPYIGASSVPAQLLTHAWSSSTAADSCNIAIDVGPTASGPWISNAFINALTLTGSTPLRNTILISTTANHPTIAPFWRVRVDGKGATSASLTFRFFFPALSVEPMQAVGR